MKTILAKDSQEGEIYLCAKEHESPIRIEKKEKDQVRIYNIRTGNIISIPFSYPLISKDNYKSNEEFDKVVESAMNEQKGYRKKVLSKKNEITQKRKEIKKEIKKSNRGEVQRFGQVKYIVEKLKKGFNDEQILQDIRKDIPQYTKPDSTIKVICHIQRLKLKTK